VSDCVDLPANLAVRRHTCWRRSVLVLVIAVGGSSPRRAHAREEGLGLVRRHARLPAHNQYPGSWIANISAEKLFPARVPVLLPLEISKTRCRPALESTSSGRPARSYWWTHG
jgi:hypothetical protein